MMISYFQPEIYLQKLSIILSFFNVSFSLLASFFLIPLVLKQIPFKIPLHLYESKPYRGVPQVPSLAHFSTINTTFWFCHLQKLDHIITSMLMTPS